MSLIKHYIARLNYHYVLKSDYYIIQTSKARYTKKNFTIDFNSIKHSITININMLIETMLNESLDSNIVSIGNVSCNKDIFSQFLTILIKEGYNYITTAEVYPSMNMVKFNNDLGKIVMLRMV